MKVFKKGFFTIILFALSIFDVLGQGPPPPAPPPPPPGLPIDEDIFMGIIIALLFGIYIIYSFRLKTKTPT
ncbi:hypothetical protein ACM55G_02915 [Flavobacterium sp. LB3P122]|uniref:hypothetical protein n=1 Tax=Flavobacterium algoriphilum TaxID=3398738 RepID=UPI003A852892